MGGDTLTEASVKWQLYNLYCAIVYYGRFAVLWNTMTFQTCRGRNKVYCKQTPMQFMLMLELSGVLRSFYITFHIFIKLKKQQNIVSVVVDSTPSLTLNMLNIKWRQEIRSCIIPCTVQWSVECTGQCRVYSVLHCTTVVLLYTDREQGERETSSDRQSC